jgi:hypothetical protein
MLTVESWEFAKGEYAGLTLALFLGVSRISRMLQVQATLKVASTSPHASQSAPQTSSPRLPPFGLAHHRLRAARA